MTYSEILAAAQAVQEALEAKARAAEGTDEGAQAACAVLDADRAVMALKVLVALYGSEVQS